MLRNFSINRELSNFHVFNSWQGHFASNCSLNFKNLGFHYVLLPHSDHDIVTLVDLIDQLEQLRVAALMAISTSRFHFSILKNV